MFTVLVFFALGLNTAVTTFQPTPAEIRTRLANYERHVDAGKSDVVELGDIARAVHARAEGSSDLDAMIQACASPDVTDDAACRARLWKTAKLPSASPVHRANAAATLARRKDKEALGYLFELVKSMSPAQLARVTGVFDVLPPDRSVAFLEPLLKDATMGAQAAGCRQLAKIDALESRRAIAVFLETAPRGTDAWFACTIAAAQLGDATAVQAVRYMHTYMSNDNLVEAGSVLVNVDQELGVSLLMQATRESIGFPQVDAADRLVPFRRDVAIAVMERTLQRDVPELVAGALELHRNLALEPSREIRGLLLHPSALVQLRAAQTVLSWTMRQKPAKRP